MDFFVALNSLIIDLSDLTVKGVVNKFSQKFRQDLLECLDLKETLP
jgi:hypothetical protein